MLERVAQRSIAFIGSLREASSAYLAQLLMTLIVLDAARGALCEKLFVDRAPSGGEVE